MNTFQKLAVVSLLTLSVVSCSKKETDFTDPLVTNRDTTANPADDFFAYANGGWFKKHPIPASERSNGIFRMIQDTINNQIKNICESSAKANDAKGSNKQKIGDFYASGMDSIAINKAGTTPIKALFTKIDGVKDIPSLLQTIAHLHTIGAGGAFNFYVSQDDKNSAKNALQFMQGGLGLGQRDYYFETDKQTTMIRNEYVKHIQAMMQLVGDTPEVAALKLETKNLENKLNAYDNEKIELEKLLIEFQHRHTIELGEVILSILKLRKIKFKDNKEKYEEAEKDEKQYREEVATEKEREVFDLDENQKVELKRKFRKATVLCHPDKVNDEFKEAFYCLLSPQKIPILQIVDSSLLLEIYSVNLLFLFSPSIAEKLCEV